MNGALPQTQTYQGSQEVFLALLEALEGILFVAGALDDLGDSAGADVAQDGLDLVGGGGVLGDVELKGLAAGLGLGRVVAGLVEGGADLGVGRDLLDEVGDAHRGWRAGLVEDGDDVEGLVLFGGELVVSWLRQMTAVWLPRERREGNGSIELTKRNMLADWVTGP